VSGSSDRKTAEDEDDRRRDLAEVGDPDQQGRGKEEDEDRLDVVHEHITSGLVDERLSPPLDELDHVRGERAAPLELVMFGDFQCPFCLGAQSILRRVRDRLGDRLLFAFRHLPIPERHPLAPMAAEASEAVAAQGKFWEYHDALFPEQPKLSAETILQVGRDLGLDAKRMAAEIDSGVHRPRVERDVASAAASGATGTPTFFINGERFFGAYDASSLIEALEG
jgi:protein-disulfide isomerase